MPRCHITLGGNQGSVRETFERAIEQLERMPQTSVVQVSRAYRTSAVGDEAGEDFLNAAAEIETELPPVELLGALLSVESELGRTRQRRWGPRSLDLDLIFYGDQVIDLPRLRVPHPACWYRRFVLDPLTEIAADVVHPEKRLTVKQLRDRLLIRPLRFALTGADAQTRRQLIEKFRVEFADAEFSQWPLAGDWEPALLVGLPSCDTTSASSVPAAKDLCRLAWLDASQLKGDLEFFLRSVLQSALGTCRKDVPC